MRLRVLLDFKLQMRKMLNELWSSSLSQILEWAEPSMCHKQLQFEPLKVLCSVTSAGPNHLFGSRPKKYSLYREASSIITCCLYDKHCRRPKRQKQRQGLAHCTQNAAEKPEKVAHSSKAVHSGFRQKKFLKKDTNSLLYKALWCAVQLAASISDNDVLLLCITFLCAICCSWKKQALSRNYFLGCMPATVYLIYGNNS